MSKADTNGHTDAERVALYLRVSSEEQRDHDNIDLQAQFFADYTRLYGLEVIHTYTDDGVSGTIPLAERPEGARLLEDAAKGEFDPCSSTSSTALGASSSSPWMPTTGSSRSGCL
jgi:DNA invertase Pin-like site-specific DNA recombinase